MRIEWVWWLRRPGFGPMIVTLKQYQRVEHASAVMLEADFWADPDYSHTPKLQRVAIVSAPVKGPPPDDEPIAETFNEQVGEALRKAALRAERRGFRPKVMGDDWTAWREAYNAYKAPL